MNAVDDLNYHKSHKREVRKVRSWKFSEEMKTNYKLSPPEGQHVQPDVTGFVFQLLTVL